MVYGVWGGLPRNFASEPKFSDFKTIEEKQYGYNKMVTWKAREDYSQLEVQFEIYNPWQGEISVMDADALVKYVTQIRALK